MLPAMWRAKRPVSAPLAGPYGHPYHPALASIPVGAWVASLIFDIASHLVSKPAFLAAGAEYLIAVGIVGAILAGLVGFLDLALIAEGTPAYRTACTHMALNVLLTCAYAADFGWRRHVYNNGAPVGTGMVALSAACVVLLVVSGFLGGRLAFRYGVRVAAEVTQADGYLAAGASGTGQRASDAHNV